MLDGWLLIVTGPKLIDELRRSPDDELSSTEGTTQVISPPSLTSPRLILTHDRLGTHLLSFVNSTSSLASIVPHARARCGTPCRSSSCGTRSARASTTSSTSRSSATSSRATSPRSSPTFSTRSRPRSRSTSPRRRTVRHFISFVLECCFFSRTTRDPGCAVFGHGGGERVRVVRARIDNLSWELS